MINSFLLSANTTEQYHMQFYNITFPNVKFNIYFIIRGLKVHRVFKEKKDHREKDIQGLR